MGGSPFYADKRPGMHEPSAPDRALCRFPDVPITSQRSHQRPDGSPVKRRSSVHARAAARKPGVQKGVDLSGASLAERAVNR